MMFPVGPAKNDTSSVGCFQRLSTTVRQSVDSAATWSPTCWLLVNRAATTMVNREKRVSSLRHTQNMSRLPASTDSRQRQDVRL